MKILIISHKDLNQKKKKGTGTRISHIVKHFSKKHEVRYVTKLMQEKVDWCDCIYIIQFQSVLRYFDVLMEINKPIYYELQSFWAWEKKCPEEWLDLEYRIIEKSKATFAFSTQLKDFYVKKGIDEKKIHITLPGFDMDDFEFIVTYLGNFEKWQGLDILFESVKIFPWITFVLIGEKKGDCPDLPNVEYAGYKEGKEKMRLLKMSDLLIIPRKDEMPCQTMPGKIADYVLADVPIMTTKVCDLEEYADLTCEPNADSIATRITSCYHEKKRSFEVSVFNIENITDKILKVVEK